MLPPKKSQGCAAGQSVLGRWPGVALIRAVDADKALLCMIPALARLDGGAKFLSYPDGGCVAAIVNQVVNQAPNARVYMP